MANRDGNLTCIRARVAKPHRTKGKMNGMPRNMPPSRKLQLNVPATIGPAISDPIVFIMHKVVKSVPIMRDSTRELTRERANAPKPEPIV